jgi:hypothetical protein
MIAKLERTAEALGSRSLKRAALDVVDEYAACRIYCDCVDQLLRLGKGSEKEALRLISEARAWLKSELVPHGRKLDRLLDKAASEL